MKKLSMKILAIAIVVLCILSIGVFGAVSAGGNQDDPSESPTPTATATASPTATATASPTATATASPTATATASPTVTATASPTATATASPTATATASPTATATASPTATATASPTTKITSVSINITAPVAKEKPDIKPTTSDKSYTISEVTWWSTAKREEGTDLRPAVDTFKAEAAYTVEIELQAKDGYIFDTSINNKSNVKINGNAVDNVRLSNSKNTATIIYTFPATGKLAGPEISLSINPTNPKIPSNANTVTVTYSYTITGNPTSATLDCGEGTAINLGVATNGTITGSKTHEFNHLGSFTARLTATNANATTTKDITFSVGQEGLAAIIEAGPLTGVAPLKVTLNDKSTGSITTRTWNFGDGTVSSGEKSTSHTYEKPGTYTITLTVSDGRDTDSATKTITVTEAKDTGEKEKNPVDYDPLLTIGDLDVPSPFDLIAEFVRLLQAMFNFDNYLIFDSFDDE